MSTRPPDAQLPLTFDRPAPAPAPAAPRPAPPPVYSVSQVVDLAARRLETAFGDIWVEGEVSNLSRPRSGHAYFTLKDQGAQLGTVMFRPALAKLTFRLEDGQKLRVRGKLTIYEAQGRFQLYAQFAEPVGLGALQLAFEQLKARLSAEGLFDPRHKKPLPRLPRRIAVVTSLSGAAVRDILRVLFRRFPVRVIICPTRVQGTEAPGEIAEALRRADRLGVDLLIVGRGGGSLEDLWAFNTEEVARAIFASRTPIISAVGHEVDVTIADLVADHRAPTPSAAAEIAVPERSELQKLVADRRVRLERAIRHRRGEAVLALLRLQRRLEAPHRLLNRNRQHLDELTSALDSRMRDHLRRRTHRLALLVPRLQQQEPRLRLARARSTLDQLRSRLLHAAPREMQRHRQRLDSLERGLHRCPPGPRLERLRRDLLTLDQRLVAAFTALCHRRRVRLQGLCMKLEALSPLQVLARGYAVVEDSEGQVVREAERVQPGDRLRLRLHRGEVHVQVRDTRPPDGSTPKEPD